MEKRLRRGVMQQLESLQRSGVTHLARCSPPEGPPTVEGSALREEGAAKVAKANTAAPSEEPRSNPAPVDGANGGPAAEQPSVALKVIADEVAACTRCPELVSTRTQTVFGVGDPQARLCFLGEAPGADEDRQGEPFVGRAGQLLTKIIEACTLRREDVYILNVLKCRPPGNRNPSPDEAAACRGFLDRQLAIIQPEYLCCLGTIAAQTLLETTTPIGKLRGQFHEYRGVKVLCTYHPAYLLRNPAAKRLVWDDMRILMAEMGVPLP